MLRKILFALASFALLAPSSLSYAKGTRVQMSFNLLPTGTARAGSALAGVATGDLDLEVGFGTTLAIYFPIMKYLELGVATHSSFNVKTQNFPLKAGKLIDLVMPVRVPFMITESFEVRPFVEFGLQGAFYDGKSKFGPVLIPGLGVEYKIGSEKIVGLTADLAYSMGWAGVDINGFNLIKGVNYLQMRMGVSFQIN